VSDSVHASGERVIEVVAKLAGLEARVLGTRSWRRSVANARTAAAYLLRQNCKLSRVQAGQYVSRSDQTISDLTTRARRALQTGGPVAELITASAEALQISSARSSILARDAASPNAGTPLENSTPQRLSSLRSWRISRGLTQAEVASRASIARETLIRLEHGRPATPRVAERLSVALNVHSELLSGTAHFVEPQAPRTSVFLMPGLRRWREFAGLTQAQLAARTAIARETISSMENGRRARVEVVRRVAVALAVAPSVLTGDDALNDPNSAIYRVCSECGALRPTTGFIPIKGTNGFYLRCRMCRRYRARERYRTDPSERERQKARARANRDRRRLMRQGPNKGPRWL
jgi:transcriptional regulator with XRE-family HTH domain